MLDYWGGGEGLDRRRRGMGRTEVGRGKVRAGAPREREGGLLDPAPCPSRGPRILAALVGDGQTRMEGRGGAGQRASPTAGRGGQPRPTPRLPAASWGNSPGGVGGGRSTPLSLGTRERG